jgi:hypothetical protein
MSVPEADQEVIDQAVWTDHYKLYWRNPKTRKFEAIPKALVKGVNDYSRSVIARDEFGYPMIKVGNWRTWEVRRTWER